MAYESVACSLCPTCIHYSHHSGSSSPHRCSKGSSTIREAKETSNCNRYSPKK